MLPTKNHHFIPESAHSLGSLDDEIITAFNSTSAHPLTPSPETKVNGYFEFHQSYEKESLEKLIDLASQGSSEKEIELIQKTRLDWTKERENYLLFVKTTSDYFLKEIGYHATPTNCAKAIFENIPIENRQKNIESLNKILLTGILNFKKRNAEIEALSKNASYNTNFFFAKLRYNILHNQ